MGTTLRISGDPSVATTTFGVRVYAPAVRRIALVDHTKKHPPEPGVLEAIAEAITIQIERDFAPAWGIAPREVRVGGAGDKIHVFDSAHQAREFGWHQVDAQGLPYAHAFLSGSLSEDSGWIDGTASVAMTIGHEALEMLVDPAANEYAFDGRRLLWATEVCDPVQAHSYRIKAGGLLVPVTDFVHPSFFNAWGQPPFDQLGVLTAPFTLAKGGYAVCQTTGTAKERFRRFTVEFDDAMPEAQRRAKTRGYGRTYWRRKLHP
jgi:hypothetical protein